MEVILQSSGSHVAVGLEGDEEEIAAEFESFRNHGGIKGCHYISERFLYFWTTYVNLKIMVARQLRSRVVARTGIELVGEKSLKKFELEAEKVIEGWKRGRFLRFEVFEQEPSEV